MEVLLVRHAHAGSKDRWGGEDRLRPLSHRGRADAQALVGLLAPFDPGRVISSPYLRCVRTVEPLAVRLELGIEESELLVPDAGDRAAALVRELGTGPARSVVCTHGETIDVLQDVFRPTAAASNGAAPFAPGDAHEKGSVWLLEFASGSLTTARYLPPPRVAEGRRGGRGVRS